MKRERVRLDPGLPGLSALGVERVGQLLDPAERPSARAHPLSGGPGSSRLRYPLPGTPERPDGLPDGKPQGAGTGWVRLERWHRSPWRVLVRSRLTHPRSASLAERHWNLLCHLRAHGVGTPEPLAVGARGEGFVSRDSFLVTRELDGFEPVPSWLARERRPEPRRRGLAAIGTALAGLLRAGVRLPHLAPAELWLRAPEDGGDACGAGGSSSPVSGLRVSRSPTVAVADVAGGEIARLAEDEVVELLARLSRSAPDASPCEQLRVARLALRDREPVASRALRRRVADALRGSGARET